MPYVRVTFTATGRLYIDPDDDTGEIDPLDIEDAIGNDLPTDYALVDLDEWEATS